MKESSKCITSIYDKILKFVVGIFDLVVAIYKSGEKVFTFRAVCKCRPYFSDQKCEF
jgi:DNA-directed RNA polymerase alpha subunit